MNLPCLRWNLITCLLFITYFAKAQTDSLQSCSNACCVIDPTPAGIMVSNLHTKKELMFSYKFMHMNMGKMISGSSTFSDKNDLIVIKSLSFSVDTKTVVCINYFMSKPTLKKN